jgi:hypothetical protein
METVPPPSANLGRRDLQAHLDERAVPSGRPLALALACAGRKPPIWAVKRPARPYKTAMRNRFTMGNAQANT